MVKTKHHNLYHPFSMTTTEPPKKKKKKKKRRKIPYTPQQQITSLLLADRYRSALAKILDLCRKDPSQLQWCCESLLLQGFYDAANNLHRWVDTERSNQDEQTT